MKKRFIDKSFALNLKMMRWNGLFPPSSNNLLYRIYAFTLYISVSWIFPCMAALATIFDENADISRITDTLYLLPQMWILAVKILPFIRKPEGVKDLLERLQSGKFIHRLPEHQTIIEKCSDECRKLYMFFATASYTALVLWALKPLTVKDKIVPMEIILPYELTKEHPSYLPILTFINLCVAYGASWNPSLDCLISGLIYHVSAQIKILKDKLTFLDKRAEQATAHIKDPREKEAARSDMISFQLQECIDHHDNIISYIKDLEKMFSSVPFIQLIISTVVICISCFQVMILDPKSMNFLGLIVYVITMICQIYMYCHYGNELYHESCSIVNAVYMSNWYEFDEKSKKMILILMERGKKPLIFKAGNMLPLSVETFVSIMRKAYSLLAVLQNYK